ncbi:MAG TPA: hypothetical protein VF656_06805 [Pyrinomonadaceae bacterium]|jgi:hypothetical protein
MSETENIPQDQDYPEEEPSNGEDSGSADPGDVGGAEGDPPIIIHRSGSSVSPG